MPERQTRRMSMNAIGAGPMLTTLLALVAVIAVACGSSDSDPEETTVPPTIDANATPLERLTAIYTDPTVDPSADAWSAVLADPEFDTKSVSVVEFVSLTDDDDATQNYDSFVDAITAALTASGGEMLSVNDIMMPGLEGLDAYEGGISWVATFPSLAAYVDAMLDERVVATAQQRRDAVAEAYVLIGPNLVPDVITKGLPPNAPASNFHSEAVAGKTSEQIIDDLLAIYPSGGADPTESTLERMIAFDGWQDQRVHFINLYRFKDGGAASLSEYNAGAFPIVVAHGGRPKALVDITHQLVGPIEWDRFIFVAWPSLAVFTDLRLEPEYIEAQKDRVVSGEQYGNLINIARADQPGR